MDQPKMERMLRLMKFLSGNVNYSVQELSVNLGMSVRTIYRYIDTFKSAGFAVTKLHGDCYKLGSLPKDTLDLERLIYFSEEEAYLVNSLIDGLTPTNSLKSNLKQKLSAIYKSTSIAEYVDARSNAAHVQTLGEAIDRQLKVVLKNYESGNSHTIRDRFIEPFAFTADYIDVWGYDLEDGKNKTFKIARIDEVVLTGGAWSCEMQHRKSGTDIFRMSGEVPYRVKLRLSFMAKNLLVEEYPLAGKYLSREGKDWILDTEVFSMNGVGRFVSGLMGEVEIIVGEELRSFLKEYGKKFFDGVNERYTAYAKLLEPKIGIPYTTITPLIFIFVRSCVHYAMFEDEYYLKSQMEILKQGVSLFAEKYRSQYQNGGDSK